MRQLLLVSGNRHKEQEMSKILGEYGIKLRRRALPIQEPDLESLERVAEEKAKQAFALVKRPLIVEDTGVYFDAYKSFPGLFAKRMYLSLGFPGLLKLLEGRKRTGHFKVAVTYIWEKSKFKTFTGKLPGTFTTRVHDRNRNVLPYEKIFIPLGKKKTLSSVSREEKNTFSHRAIATEKFGKWFKKNNSSG